MQNFTTLLFSYSPSIRPSGRIPDPLNHTTYSFVLQDVHNLVANKSHIFKVTQHEVFYAHRIN